MVCLAHLGVCGEFVWVCCFCLYMESCLRDGCGVSGLEGLPIWVREPLLFLLEKWEVFCSRMGCWFS
jgi:hypothetical protein